MSTSYQLPNFITLVQDFELDVNRFCREVTTASEEWFLTNDDVDESERRILRSGKYGLLAAVCFPACDAPQLRLVTDFLTLLFISNARTGLCSTCDWNAGQVGGSCLGITQHRLFRHIVPKVLQLARRAHPTWRTRFEGSTQALRAAQMRLVDDNRTQKAVLRLDDAYMSFRRDLSGLWMLFDLMELAGGFNLPEDGPLLLLLKKLMNHTVDVIGWSMDMVSYHLNRSSSGNKYNLVSVLIGENGYVVQSAINAAGNLVKQSIEAFIATERQLLTLFSSSKPPPADTERDVRLYVRGLRACVSGFINWMYETELFFGEKGSEIRFSEEYQLRI